MSWPRTRRRAASVLLPCGLLAVGALCAWLGWQALVRWKEYPVARLSARDAASVTVLDRKGRLLWRGGSSSGEQREWTALVDMAPVAVQAALASEDHRFHEHTGVDPLGVLRALWLNARAFAPAYGASTLTMQLVRLAEPELNTRSVFGKLRQALHAARLERSLSKAAILEQYLNRAYYGNGAFGLGSAAQLYFGANAAQLSPGQAAFLAALPRAPHGYDPYRHRHRAEQRMRHILGSMHELGWLSGEAWRLALDAPLALRRERGTAHARHFIDHQLLTLPEEQLRGARIESTLDLELQQRLEVATRRHLDGIGGRSVSQAGVIVIDNRSGDIMAMLGSHDYSDTADDGAVNVTTLPRRAGSTLKPFVYGLALERGDSPATLAYDVVLPGEAQETYTADVRQHGFARYREALAGSYNLAAVHTLQKVGVRALVERLRLAGVSTLTAPTETYDLNLAIGDAEIELIEYAGAFAAFGNAGRAVRPRAVRRVLPPPELAHGVASAGVAPGSAAAGGSTSSTPVFSPEVAYQIFDILSDPDARRPMFGRTAPLEVGFPVALKTGTTRGYTDNLAFGTTREFTVGAWAGNFDGSPTDGVMAMQGAAPLVRAAFVALAALYGTPTGPDRPEALTLRGVCPVSGQRPGPECPGRKQELFTPLAASAFDHAEACTFHGQHAAGGRRAAAGGMAFPEPLAPWARAHGLSNSNSSSPHLSSPHLSSSPSARQTGLLSIAYPAPGAVFQLDPHRATSAQVPPLQALPAGGVTFTIDGVPAPRFEPTPGKHVVRAQRGNQVVEAPIVFE